jgi:hypothetical protein
MHPRFLSIICTYQFRSRESRSKRKELVFGPLAMSNYRKKPYCLKRFHASSLQYHSLLLEISLNLIQVFLTFLILGCNKHRCAICTLLLFTTLCVANISAILACHFLEVVYWPLQARVTRRVISSALPKHMNLLSERSIPSAIHCHASI